MEVNTNRNFGTDVNMEKLKESITTEGSDNITNLLELTACSHDAMPNFYSYTRGMDVYGRVMFTYGAAAVVIIIFMYVDTVRHVINNSIPKAKTPTIIIISIYPVVAVVTFCAILVPRAYLLADTAAQVMFMCGVYQMFRLFIAYCGGERQLIEKVYDKKLNLKAPPCCCWPCCSFLPKVSVNTKRMHLLRVLIIQLPIVQGALYLVFLVFWAEKQKPYQVTTRLAYLQPTILITILIGIWAMRMITNVLKDVLDGYSLTAKFLALQLVTLSSQFYGLLTRILLDSGVLPCFSSITPFVLASLIYNYAMLMEMIILAYWARRLYKKVLPDLHLNEVELSPMNGDVEKQQDETIPEKLKITEPE